MKKNKLLVVGNVVRVRGHANSKITFLGEPKNSLAYVYEVYQLGRERGVSVITESGCDLGGFSPDEQEDYLVYVSTIDFKYDFRSVSWLDHDWKKGLFRPFLEEVEELKSLY